MFETRERFEELRRALNELIARHDILRTAIMWEGLRQPVQVVCRSAELMVVEHKLGEVDPEAYLRSYLKGAGSRMDLEKAPLLAIDLAQRHGDQHVHGLLRIHHTIVDHVAMDVLFEELAEILNGRPTSLLPNTVPYRNFVAHMGRSDISAAEEHFRRCCVC